MPTAAAQAPSLTSEYLDPVDGVFGDASQDVGNTGFWIDVVHRDNDAAIWRQRAFEKDCPPITLARDRY